MARINHASLRAQLNECRTQFEAIKQKGEASADTLALINALFMLSHSSRRSCRASLLPFAAG